MELVVYNVGFGQLLFNDRCISPVSVDTGRFDRRFLLIAELVGRLGHLEARVGLADCEDQKAGVGVPGNDGRSVLAALQQGLSRIDAQATDNLLLTRWRKLLWNIPFNGLSVSLDASTKDLVDDPDSLAHFGKCDAEVRGHRRLPHAALA